MAEERKPSKAKQLGVYLRLTLEEYGEIRAMIRALYEADEPIENKNSEEYEPATARTRKNIYKKFNIGE